MKTGKITGEKQLNPMAVKVIKILATIFSVMFVLSGVLYALAPSILRYGVTKGFINIYPEGRNGDTALAGARADVKEYEGEEALPKNENILFVIAHPDDLEFMAGGTLPKLLKRGNEVYLAVLTDGGKQRYMPAFYSKMIVKTRREEQLAIAKIEGLKEVFFINYPDGGLKYGKEAVNKIGGIIKKIGATCIFTFEPGKRKGYYDSDHDAAGQIAGAAAGKDNPVQSLYYFRPAEPNIVIDISDTFEKKIDTLFMFTEFRYKKGLLRAMHEIWASTYGEMIGVKYAETFAKPDLLKPNHPSKWTRPDENQDKVPAKEKTN